MAARLEWGKIDTRFLEERDARQPGCRHASCTLVYARRLNGEAPAGAGQVAGRGGGTIDVDGAGLRPAPIPPEAGPTPRIRLTGGLREAVRAPKDLKERHLAEERIRTLSSASMNLPVAQQVFCTSSNHFPRDFRGH
jgi:hypothetical protein